MADIVRDFLRIVPSRAWIPLGIFRTFEMWQRNSEQKQRVHDRSQKLDERKKYLNWICELEYERLELPKPDTILFLKVPVGISLELLAGKKGRDLAEKSIPYLTNSLA